MSATTALQDTASQPPAPTLPVSGHYRIVPARYPWRVAGTVFSALVIVLVLQSVLTNPRWGWDVFAEWFFSAPVLEGLGRTLLLTVLGSALGFLFGTLLALARISGSPLLAGLSWSYVWLLRSIPRRHPSPSAGW